jgi:hypothetical protein
MMVTQLVLGSVSAFAQIQTKPVSFPAGKSSTKISGTIKGDQSIDHTVSAKAGQQMHVTLTSKSTSVNFNVLPPGSNDVAIFIGSTEGTKYDGTLTADGVYKIRVYLMGSAARKNEPIKYELSVSIPAGSKTADAKVAGTPYHATGKVPAAVGSAKKGSVQADFGVIRRSGGSAELHLKMPNGTQQKIKFEQGEWTCINCKNIKYTKSGDEWSITLNNTEHYYVPDAVITGG